MSTTCVGKFWSALSTAATITTIVGAGLPRWLKGHYVTESGEDMPLYFGISKRCTYPVVGPDGLVTTLDACNEYDDYFDVPSGWWEMTCGFVVLGMIINLIITFVGFTCHCFANLYTVKIAYATCVAQLLAGLFIVGGLASYPAGLGAREVSQACGNVSDIYVLGECSLDYGFYVTCVGAVLTLLCSPLVCCSFEFESRFSLSDSFKLFL